MGRGSDSLPIRRAACQGRYMGHAIHTRFVESAWEPASQAILDDLALRELVARAELAQLRPRRLSEQEGLIDLAGSNDDRERAEARKLAERAGGRSTTNAGHGGTRGRMLDHAYRRREPSDQQQRHRRPSLAPGAPSPERLTAPRRRAGRERLPRRRAAQDRRGTPGSPAASLSNPGSGASTKPR